jgi:hypothetical protein
MKTVLIIIWASAFISHGAQAQTFEEWFRQKRTQRKYLIQQIAALKTYLEYLKEGYDVAKKGLNIIGDIKGMNFSDHSNYFQSLKNVNLSLKNFGKIGDIIAYPKQIMIDFARLRKEQTFTPEETQYIEQVYHNLMVECEWSIAHLKQVLSDETLEMKDDGRMTAIDLAYEDMKDKYTFTRSFINSVRILSMQRSREQFQVQASEKLNQNPY